MLKKTTGPKGMLQKEQTAPMHARARIGCTRAHKHAPDEANDLDDKHDTAECDDQQDVDMPDRMLPWMFSQMSNRMLLSNMPSNGSHRMFPSLFYRMFYRMFYGISNRTLHRMPSIVLSSGRSADPDAWGVRGGPIGGAERSRAYTTWSAVVQ